MKKEFQFLHSLNDIDDSLIDEAIEFKMHKFPSLSKFKLVPILSFSMCLLLLFVFISNQPKNDTSDVLVTNPMSEISSLDEAQAQLGYSLSIPEIENTTKEYYLINSMIEVRYMNHEEQKYIIRKDIGSEDCSGIYTTYEETKTISSNGIDITISGNNNLYYLATWTSGDYTYSFYAVDGLNEQALLSYVNEIN